MMKIKLASLGLAISISLASALSLASVSKDLPLPTGDLTANALADQVYFVNHFYAVKNYSIQKEGRNITVLINKSKDARPKTITLERYLNNDYSDGQIKARDLAIFRSGKLKGTGMLITDYVDDNKSQSYSIWLPALRKIRRFAEPSHDDAWGGTDFTFGDVTLRKPQHETHELLGKTAFKECLGAIDLPEDQRNKYTQNLPKATCVDTEVHQLKSTTKYDNWWYDYRISYVDLKTFVDYRTEYFKGDEKIKVIDRSWIALGGDPRAQAWKYWYGKTLATGHETWAVIPDTATHSNEERPANFWSENTLRKIKR